MNAAKLVREPNSVVNVTSTAPATPAGAIAVIRDAEAMVNDAASVAPKRTLVAWSRNGPVMATAPPPAVVP